MNDDPLDDVRRTLFASARKEEPDQALLERVLNLDAATASEGLLDRTQTTATPRAQSLRRSRLHARGPALGVWLAALAAGGLAVLGKYALDAGGAMPSISAEQHPPSSNSIVARGAEVAPSAPASAPALDPAPREAAVPTREPPPASPAVAPHLDARARAITKHEHVQSVPPSMPVSEPPAGASSSPQPALLAQINLLKGARTALRAGDASTALTLLDRYSSDLHGTDLNAEATLLRIETLTALDRGSEATALAERFVAENPDSPLVDRARSFLDRPTSPIERKP